MNIRLRRPSPALVIACLALFVSMGGVSYGFATGSIDSREIRNGAVTTKDLRNNEVRGRDLRNSTIGGRDVAFNTLTGSDIAESKLAKVPRAGQADNATTAGSAASAASAGNANTLGGVAPSGFVRSETPAFGPITLAAGWTAVAQTPPGIDIDNLGYAHLRGTMSAGAGNTAFTLPAGQRPQQGSSFAVREGPNAGTLTISDTGVASSGAAQGLAVSLDGITYAVAP